MAILFSPPRFKATDRANAPISGAFLQFFQYQTSTLQPIYTDSTLQLPLLNPLKADANGLFSEIWLDDSLPPYKVVFSSPDVNDSTLPGAIIWTIQQYNASFSVDALTPLLNPQTPAEIAAGVTPTNFSYPPLDLRRYYSGGTYDIALANAISVCGANGGTITLVGGSYSFANAINLQGANSVIIQGQSAMTGGAQPAVRFSYTGTGSGVWINMNDATGCQFRGIQFVHTSASFTGTYIQCNHLTLDPAFNGLFDCTLGSSVGGVTHLDLNKCVEFTCERVNFIYGNPSVSLAQASGYSNVIRFRDCQWNNCITTPVQNNGPAQAITFESCTFENLLVNTGGASGGTSVGAAVLSVSSTGQFAGLSFIGCWFGDITSTATCTWIDVYGNGLFFAGNYISGNVTGTTAIVLRQFGGAEIVGNDFDHLLRGVNFFVASCVDIVIQANTFNTVTTTFANPNNVSQGSFVWAPNFGLSATPPGSNHGILASPGFMPRPDGLIEAWGSATVTTGTPLAITYAGAGLPNMSTQTFNVDLTLAGPSGTTNSAYLSGALATTGFTINVGGTAGTSTVLWRALGN